MSWFYKGKEIKDISHFPENTFGFVYRIFHIPSGRAYIGKKVLYHNRKTKLTKKDLALYEGQPGRKPTYKVVVKESDCKTYCGSNKTLLELIKIEPEKNFMKYIILFSPSKKLLTYYETKYLFIHEVLEKPDEYFNDNIQGRFYTKDFDS